MDLSEKVTFAQRPKGGEGGSLGTAKRRRVQVEEARDDVRRF